MGRCGGCGKGGYNTPGCLMCGQDNSNNNRSDDGCSDGGCSNDYDQEGLKTEENFCGGHVNWKYWDDRRGYYCPECDYEEERRQKRREDVERIRAIISSPGFLEAMKASRLTLKKRILVNSILRDCHLMRMIHANESSNYETIISSCLDCLIAISMKEKKRANNRAKRARKQARENREKLVEKFIICCRDGKLEEAKRISREKLTFDVDISDYAKAFNLACRSGKIEVAQWLFDEKYIEAREQGLPCLNDSDILNGFNSSFTLEHLDIIEWLCPILSRAFPDDESEFEDKRDIVAQRHEDKKFAKQCARRARARARKEMRQLEIYSQLKFVAKPLVKPESKLPVEIIRHIKNFLVGVNRPVLKDVFPLIAYYKDRIPKCDCKKWIKKNHSRGHRYFSMSCQFCNGENGYQDGRYYLWSDAEKYIKKGGDPDYCLKLTKEPLPLPIYFLEQGKLDIVEKLIDAGADVTIVGRNNSNLLQELFRRVKSSGDYHNDSDSDCCSYSYSYNNRCDCLSCIDSDNEDSKNSESFESLYSLIKKVIRNGGRCDIDTVNKDDFNRFIDVCFDMYSIPKLTRPLSFGYKEFTNEGLDFFDSHLLRNNKQFIGYLIDLRRSNKCGKYIRSIIDRFIKIDDGSHQDD